MLLVALHVTTGVANFATEIALVSPALLLRHNIFPTRQSIKPAIKYVFISQPPFYACAKSDGEQAASLALELLTCTALGNQLRLG